MGSGPAALPLHFPNAKGFKYALVCIDAYSRWAEAEPLEDKCAATVADALVRSVITNTAGHPKLLISDQGSEFKGDLADAVKMLRVTHRYTAGTDQVTCSVSCDCKTYGPTCGNLPRGRLPSVFP